MKNITVSVDEQLYHQARVAAAQHHTNVTALLRAYLRALVAGKAPLLSESKEDQERQNREELVRLFRAANLELGYQPNRDKTYER